MIYGWDRVIYFEVPLLTLSCILTVFKLSSDLKFKDETSHSEVIKSKMVLPKAPAKLIGRKKELECLMKEFSLKTRPRIISIYGLRGLGKTVLLEEAARKALSEKLIDEVCWQTSKNEKLVGPKIEKIRNITINASDVIGKFEKFKEKNPKKKLLFILENVDSIDNPKELIIKLYELIGENLCFITSRRQIGHQLVRPLLLEGLTEKEGKDFLRTQAKILQVKQIINASDEKLLNISRELGGNPLALKLLIVLSKFYPIDSSKERILNGTLDLERNSGSIYTYIYQDIWKELSPRAKEILFHISKTGEICELTEIENKFSEYTNKEIEDEVSLLLKNCFLSLSEESDETCMKYSLDTLTRNFLQSQIPQKWD